jgi:hypothetical protein
MIAAGMMTDFFTVFSCCLCLWPAFVRAGPATVPPTPPEAASAQATSCLPPLGQSGSLVEYMASASTRASTARQVRTDRPGDSIVAGLPGRKLKVC